MTDLTVGRSKTQTSQVQLNVATECYKNLPERAIGMLQQIPQFGPDLSKWTFTAVVFGQTPTGVYLSQGASENPFVNQDQETITIHCMITANDGSRQVEFSYLKGAALDHYPTSSKSVNRNIIVSTSALRTELESNHGLPQLKRKTEEKKA